LRPVPDFWSENVQNEEPGTEVTRRLQELVALPREDIQIELKGWLDLTDGEEAADLGKALLALANSGGGFVLIGFGEGDGGWQTDSDRPSSLTSFSQDAVNGIVARYAEPAFHCQVHQVEHPETTDLFPVVVVPGGHRVPIRAKADSPERSHIRINTYYIRRPGPSSDAPRTAREWDELIGRCVRATRDGLIDAFREIVEVVQAPASRDTLEALLLGQREREPDGPARSRPETASASRLNDWISESRARFEERVARRAEQVAAGGGESDDRYAHGVYTVAYSLDGRFEPPEMPAFRHLLQGVQGHETGWPPWLFLSADSAAPVLIEKAIEAWLIDRTVFADPAHSDFWRATPSGFLYLLRGYADDSQADRFPPGTRFEVTLPIWEIAPCLLHAERLASALGDSAADVRFRVVWEGLAGRELSTWANPRRMPPSRRPAVQDRVESEVSIAADRIVDRLPELMHQLTTELYAAFDFFELPPGLIREELAEMRGVS
jgi:hypothetical protein